MLCMATEETLTLGDAVREYRKRAKLTQEQLADKVNVTRATISQIENGDIKRPKNYVLRGFEAVLGLSVKYAWELIGERNPEEEDDPTVLFQRIAALPDIDARMQAYSELPEPVRQAVERLMLDRMTQIMQQLAASSGRSSAHGKSV